MPVKKNNNKEQNKISINLSTVERVKRFISFICQYRAECNLTSWDGKYIVDAKSVMGVFSLDLSKPVKLEIYTNDQEEAMKIMNGLSEYTDV